MAQKILKAKKRKVAPKADGRGAERIRQCDDGEDVAPQRPDCALCESCAVCSPCPLSQAVLLLILRDCGYVAPTLVAIATHRDREEAICSLD